MIANDPYAELERRFARLSAVNRASAILNWDRSTMMPSGASEDRADQLATLGVIAHGMIAAPDMPELLSRAEEEARDWIPGAPPTCARCAALWSTPTRCRADLVEALARATSACEMAWREAKKQGRLRHAADARRGRPPHVRGEARSPAPRSASRPTTRCSTRTSPTCATPPSAAIDGCRPSCRLLLEAALARQDARPAPASR